MVADWPSQFLIYDSLERRVVALSSWIKTSAKQSRMAFPFARPPVPLIAPPSASLLAIAQPPKAQGRGQGPNLHTKPLNKWRAPLILLSLLHGSDRCHVSTQQNNFTIWHTDCFLKTKIGGCRRKWCNDWWKEINVWPMSVDQLDGSMPCSRWYMHAWLGSSRCRFNAWLLFYRCAPDACFRSESRRYPDNVDLSIWLICCRS